MKTHRCCAAAAGDSRTEPFTPSTKNAEMRRQPFAGRAIDLAGWIFSGAILALMPKCPACLAAYVAASTGLGLSLPVANGLRTMLLVLCIASMLYLGLRMLRSFASGVSRAETDRGCP